MEGHPGEYVTPLPASPVALAREHRAVSTVAMRGVVPRLPVRQSPRAAVHVISPAPVVAIPSVTIAPEERV